MLHFNFPATRGISARYKRAILILVVVGSLTSDSIAKAENIINSVSAEQSSASIDIRIKGSEPPAYTVYELFKPTRVVLDVADVKLDQSSQFTLPPELGITLTTSRVPDTSPTVTRFEFTLQKSVPFSTDTQENDILLTLNSPDQISTSTSDQASPTQVNDINIQTGADFTKIIISATNKINDYKYNVLEKKGDAPPRLYVDINNVKGEGLLQEKLVGTSINKIRVANRGSGLRIVLDATGDQLFPFQILEIEKGLEIQIEEKTAPQDKLSSIISKKSQIVGQLPQVDPLDKELSPAASEQTLQDSFSFSGYNKERISVDFYKIDLHNVFRLLREVSGINIIVDESVTGSLTLALDNVPWDFALDIILNLKNLSKEERFNTVVILPKDKTFEWASKADSNLSFEADTEVTEQEALLIRQIESMPPEVIQAKQEIAKARDFEKREDYETAVLLYEKALDLWPDNAKLANRISGIYLVQLRQNAKAAFYAKKALTIDPSLNGAALNAAIAYASMREYNDAQMYFDQSINMKEPSKQALISYAVFSEDQQAYDNALKLLSKHDELYGESLNSLIATARIFDKQGKTEQANKKYETILLSGFSTPPDLIKYIKGRLALQQNL